MPHTNKTTRHRLPGDTDRHSYHPNNAADWATPQPLTVQQALDDLATRSDWPLIDSNDLVQGSADDTKRMRIEVDGVSASTTRVLIMPDHDVDLGGDFASANHTHSAGDIDSGLLALARGGLNASASGFTNSELLRLNSAGTAVESAGKTADDLIAASIIDAKGDLLAATAPDTVDRLAVGTDGYVLTADSSKSSGLAWAAAHANIGARVYNSVDISCSSGTWTSLTFDTEKWDTDSIHSTVSNTGRLTCNTAGIYLITCGLLVNAGSSWTVAMRLRRTPSGGSAVTIAAHTKRSNSHYWDLSTAYQLAVGDYVTVEHYQDSGTSKNARRASDYAVEFGMHLLAVS